ncbi:MAG: acyl-CoA/acyl-ACP dehydrogenase [Roseovarius sp.]|nr:acyl-CoA/acyl-ACP dehydrogenase [Roseovarius sp.]
MSDLMDIIQATSDRIFTDHLDAPLRRKVESGTWPQDLWQELEASGLLDALIGEDPDAPFDGLANAATVLRSAGGHAVPVPIAETLAARWFAASCGLDLENGAAAVLPTGLTSRFVATRQGETLMISGSDRRVPWLSMIGQAVVMAESDVGPVAAIVGITDTMREDRTSIASEPVSSVRMDAVKTANWAALPPEDSISLADVPRILALLRSVMMVGAAEETVSLTVKYAGEREQFGRPIGKFQAVQQNLALLTAETAASAAIVDAAVADMARHGQWGGLGDAACARIRLMSGEISRITHQVHGAIGFTQEYELHELTRRLYAWRDDYGSANAWTGQLGAQALAAGRRGLWPLVTEI